MLDRLRSDYVFFLAGFGSEYSLQPIAHYLAEHDFSFVVADMQQAPLPPPPLKATVFITSQHPSCSSAAFRIHTQETPPFSNYMSPLEIIHQLRPACSVFVPHDLEAPIRPYEFAYMSAFDIYCAPSAEVNPALRHLCKVIPAGWVKHHHFDVLAAGIKTMVESNGMFFLNQVVSLMRAGGASFVRDNYPAIFAANLPVKLPAWPGCEVMADELRQMGATVLATETNSTKLIAASPRIYVNAPGSVIAEANYVGTPVILAGKAGEPDQLLIAAGSDQTRPEFDFNRLLTAVAAHIEETK